MYRCKKNLPLPKSVGRKKVLERRFLMTGSTLKKLKRRGMEMVTKTENMHLEKRASRVYHGNDRDCIGRHCLAVLASPGQSRALEQNTTYRYGILAARRHRSPNLSRNRLRRGKRNAGISSSSIASSIATPCEICSLFLKIVSHERLR